MHKARATPMQIGIPHQTSRQKALWITHNALQHSPTRSDRQSLRTEDKVMAKMDISPEAQTPEGNN